MPLVKFLKKLNIDSFSFLPKAFEELETDNLVLLESLVVILRPLRGGSIIGFYAALLSDFSLGRSFKLLLLY